MTTFLSGLVQKSTGEVAQAEARGAGTTAPPSGGDQHGPPRDGIVGSGRRRSEQRRRVPEEAPLAPETFFGLPRSPQGTPGAPRGASDLLLLFRSSSAPAGAPATAVPPRRAPPAPRFPPRGGPDDEATTPVFAPRIGGRRLSLRSLLSDVTSRVTLEKRFQWSYLCVRVF